MAGITTRPFGVTVTGEPVLRFDLDNGHGLRLALTDLGAAVIELWVPDAAGVTADVVLGFDDVAGYESEANQSFGCTIGRVANRVAGGRFSIGEKAYRLATNNGPHHLHGGPGGFGRRLWNAAPLDTPRGPAVEFRHRSVDGEEGYPGNLEVAVRMILTTDGELRIDYRATSDAATPVNLTNHCYFNLAGHGAPTALDHELEVCGSRFTPVDDTLIPTGEVAGVAGTPLDFREPTRVGARIAELEDTPTAGYDHNLVLDGAGLRRAARLVDPASGRSMEVSTTEPGLQVYSGNFLHGQAGKGGAVYARRSGLCLEAQHFPDAPNQPSFPSVLLRPGEEYRQTTIHRFSAVAARP